MKNLYIDLLAFGVLFFSVLLAFLIIYLIFFEKIMPFSC